MLVLMLETIRLRSWCMAEGGGGAGEIEGGGIGKKYFSIKRGDGKFFRPEKWEDQKFFYFYFKTQTVFIS